MVKRKYGDRLKSVVVHDDEPHPHLHFTVIPRKGERLDDIHEGLKAKNEAKKNKQKGKVQNIAYIGAMRELQDNFYEKVAMRSGLTRLDLLALVILVRCGKQSNRMPKH